MIDLIFQNPFEICPLSVAVLILLLAFIFYGKQNQGKGLTYEVVTDTPLLTISEEFESGIDIRFLNQPVRNLHLLIIKLISTGREPILPEDFEASIEIRFPNTHARILFYEIVASRLVGVAPKIERVLSSENGCLYLRLEPMQMNRGDYLVIKMILEDYGNNINVIGKLTGVEGIADFRDLVTSLNARREVLIYSLVVGGLFFIFGGFIFDLDLWQAFGAIVLITGWIFGGYTFSNVMKGKRLFDP